MLTLDDTEMKHMNCVVTVLMWYIGDKGRVGSATAEIWIVERFIPEDDEVKRSTVVRMFFN